MTTIDTTCNTPLPEPILAWGGTQTAQDTYAAQQRSDFALRQGEFDPRFDLQKIAQAFGIPHHMLDPQAPGSSADAVLKERGAQWDAMQARMKARSAKCIRQMERFLFGPPPVTKAPRGKHGKRPSRNALRAHRASQLRTQSCATAKARLVGLCSDFTSKRYTVRFDRIDTRGMEGLFK